VKIPDIETAIVLQGSGGNAISFRQHYLAIFAQGGAVDSRKKGYSNSSPNEPRREWYQRGITGGIKDGRGGS